MGWAMVGLVAMGTGTLGFSMAEVGKGCREITKSVTPLQ